MYRKRNWFTYFIPQLYDAICIIFFFFIYVKLQYLYFYPEEHLPLLHVPNYLEIFESHYKALILILLSWFVVGKNLKLYESFFRAKLITNLKKIFIQIIYFSVILFAISGLKDYDLLSFQLAISYLSSLLILMILFRLFVFFTKRNQHIAGKNLTNILIIDENANTQKFVDVINQRRELGIKLQQIITKDDTFSVRENEVYFNDSVFEIFLEENNVSKIFVSQYGKMDPSDYRFIYDVAEKNHIEINYIPYSIYNHLTNMKIEYIDTLPVLEVKRFPLDLIQNQLVKFVFDKIFALLVCVFLLSWLIPLISLLILLDSKGPVFFVQKRNGLNGKEFGCFKFRTMRETKLNSIKATVRNDDRVTKIGKFLRKTSLDEMPQFINVLIGDMSIVGPRPHMISQDKYYKAIIEKYNLRHYVKPGITGLSQVKGHRGAIDSDLDMEKRILTDVYYVRNWSFLLDIQIIYMTIVLVLKGDENAI